MKWDELVVLGTGNAAVTQCYNTCFALRGEEGVFLVDTGGGNGILRQLKAADIALKDIHDIFITHQHTDHLLGLIWIIRFMAQYRQRGMYSGECRIYCHQRLVEIIPGVVKLLLEEKLARALGDFIHLIGVEDGEPRQIVGYDVTFFDIHSTKVEQFGFSLILSNGQRLTCLGDEPLHPANEGYLDQCDWLLCEAFCLYAEAERFKPYEKHHSTVREACQIAQRFQIPHLILWHTEDSDLPHRKARYVAEGSRYYRGDLHVPDDLDVIVLK